MARRPKPWFWKARGRWFVTIGGQRHDLGQDKGEAYDRFYTLMRQPREQKVSPEALVAIFDTFLEWCEKHRSLDTYAWYKDRLERFARTYPHLRVADIRPYHVQEWIDGMEVSSGTKRNYCRAVKRSLGWAKKQGYIKTNPIADMEMPKGGKRETVISPDQWREILGCVSHRTFHDLLIVTWETGCRPQESLRVEARHVDLGNQRWVFPETESKTEAPRVVYLTDEALIVTKRLMLAHPEGPIFRNRNKRPWTTNAVNCAFERIRIAMGRRVLEADQRGHKDKRRKYLTVDEEEVVAFMKTLNRTKQSGKQKTPAELLNEARRKLTYRAAEQHAPKFCLYDLRHTWMNRLLTKGVDALTVAFLAGHSDPSTLAKVYAHLSQNPTYLLDQARKAAS